MFKRQILPPFLALVVIAALLAATVDHGELAQTAAAILTAWLVACAGFAAVAARTLTRG